jgi:hypothetical protein
VTMRRMQESSVSSRLLIGERQRPALARTSNLRSGTNVCFWRKTDMGRTAAFDQSGHGLNDSFSSKGTPARSLRIDVRLFMQNEIQQ